MNREGPGQQPESGGLPWWTLLLAIPAVALCCGGPLLLAAVGAGLAAATAWVRGYGGLALLAAAGMLLLLWRARRRADTGHGRRHHPQAAWRKGGAG